MMENAIKVGDFSCMYNLAHRADQMSWFSLQTELQWETLPNTSRWHQIHLAREYGLYRFGLAVERKTGNQGIEWVDCIFDSRKRTLLHLQTEGLSGLEVS